MITIALLTLLALPGLFFAWSALSLQANKTKAESTGLPLLIKWVSPTNPLWMIFGSSIVHKCRALGIGTKNFRRFYLFGWEANERYAIHQELGPAYILVSPGGNWLCISDASVFADVIHRRTDFRRNMEQFEVVNVYGKNLSTTDDEEWQKHRKVTAVTFTERNNELVWDETIAQARGMLEYWIEHQPVVTIAKDTKVFTLNVLAAAIFNKSYPFEGAAEAKVNSLDDSNIYRDSLGKILSQIIPIFICGEQGLQAWWTPKSWKSAGTAIATFRDYITGLINEEREYISRGVEKNQHLVAALVRACDSENRGAELSKNGKRTMTLTEEEIISNLFVYAFAGNDTTAVSLSHLLVLMASSPETQDWIAEEIKHYLPEDDTSEWSYKTFSKLKRCLAVVMESLRLAHPLGQLVKTTGKFPQSLKIGSRTITVPPDTSVHLSLVALHADPHHWGEDALKFNPHRFITRSSGHYDPDDPFENERLASDTQPHFLPWATGQRVCPGKKFSQVELVAALATLFRNYTVQPQPQKGENMQQARERIFKTALDIDHEGQILHEMRRPESAALVWRKRE